MCFIFLEMAIPGKKRRIENQIDSKNDAHPEKVTKSVTPTR